MLVETKPALACSPLRWALTCRSSPRWSPSLRPVRRLQKTLPDTVDVIDGGIVTTKEQSMAAGDKFRTADR